MKSPSTNLSTLILAIFLAFILILSIPACQCNRDKEFRTVDERDLENLNYIDIKIMRYEKALFALNKDSLPKGLDKLKKDFSFFLTEDLNDPLVAVQLKSFLGDRTIQSLYKETINQYPDLIPIERQLTSAFRKARYFMPELQIPKVYSYVSGGDFQYPVKYAVNTMVIALDMYLGQNYAIYAMWGMPQYLTYRMKKESIIIDCMKEVARATIESKAGQVTTLLDRMIYEGKLLYFVDVTVPEYDDSLKIFYNGPQMYWAETNEGNVWAFILEKKLLYTTDLKEINKFVGEGPFTSTFSKTSAPRIGQFIGWQIVRDYMKNNPKVTIPQLLVNFNSQEIMNKSKYKPQKTEN